MKILNWKDSTLGTPGKVESRENFFPGSSAGKESTSNAGDPGSILGSGSSPEEGIAYPFQYSWTSLVAQMVKNTPAMWETCVCSWVGKIPWRRACNPLQYFCLENPHEQRSLAGYSSWYHEESEMTEWLSTKHRGKANLKQGDYVKDCNCTFRFLALYLALLPKYHLASYHTIPQHPPTPTPQELEIGGIFSKGIERF